MARIIGEVRPPYVFVENSPALTVRGLGRVLGDLAALGYDAEWGVLGAVHAGAPHKRERIWIAAHSARVSGDSDSSRELQPQGNEQEQRRRAGDFCIEVSDALRTGCQKFNAPCLAARQGQHTGLSAYQRGATWWATEPDVGRVAHGVAARVD